MCADQQKSTWEVEGLRAACCQQDHSASQYLTYGHLWNWVYELNKLSWQATHGLLAIV